MKVHLDKILNSPILHPHSADEVFLSSGVSVETAIAMGNIPDSWKNSTTEIRNMVDYDVLDDIGNFATAYKYEFRSVTNADDGALYLTPTDIPTTITLAAAGAYTADIIVNGVTANIVAAVDIAAFELALNAIANITWTKVGLVYTLVATTAGQQIAVTPGANTTDTTAAGRWVAIRIFIDTTLSQTLSNKTLLATNVIDQRSERPFYQASFSTADTIGDRRMIVGFGSVTGLLSFQRCTVANATKGSGTWVNDLEIDRDGLATFKNAITTGASQVSILNTGASGATSGSTLSLICNDGAAMASGDRLGGLRFYGAYDGSNNLALGASIMALTSGAYASDTNAPTDLVFSTQGTSGSLDEALRISSSKNLTLTNSTTNFTFTNPTTGGTGLTIKSGGSGTHYVGITATDGGGSNGITFRHLNAGNFCGFTVSSAGGANLFSGTNSLTINQEGAYPLYLQTNSITRIAIAANGNVGFGTTSPSYRISLSGSVAQAIGMERHTTANTAGNDLFILSGACTTGATDKNSGNLIFKTNTATGNGGGKLQHYTTMYAQGAGTTDRSPGVSSSLVSSVCADDAVLTNIFTIDEAAANKSGTAMITFGDGLGYGIISFTAAGAVTIISSSANVTNADTDTYFCLYAGTNQVVVKNRLGSSYNATFQIWFNQ